MRNFHLMTVAILVGLLLFSLPNDSAAKKKQEDKEKEMVELATRTKVSIEEAIKTVTEKMSGTVIEAELEQEDGKTVWEVKVVTADGELQEMYVDVQSGKIIEIKEKPKDKKSRHHEKGKFSHDENEEDEESDKGKESSPQKP